MKTNPLLTDTTLVLLFCFGAWQLLQNKHYDLSHSVSPAKSLNAPVSGGQDKLISPVSKTPRIISWPLTKAYPDAEYNIRLGVVGGKFPYVYKLTKSPDTMSIDRGRGEISWIPSSAQENQSFPVNVTVTDTLGQQTQQSFAIKVSKNDFFFVSESGNDTTGDGSKGNPWRTVDYAVDQGNTDDILYLRAGTYAGKINMDPGNINKWIAYPGDPMPLIDLQRSGIHYDDHYSYFDGLEIINAKRWAFGAGKNSYAVFRRNHMHHLYDNSTSGNPSFIWFAAGPVSKNTVIQDNIFSDLFDRGIEGDPDANYHGGAVIMYKTSLALFEDNEVYNIDGRGFNDKVKGKRTTVRGNYLHDNYLAALALGGTSNGEVLHNVLSRKHERARKILTLNTGSSNYLHHNTIIGQMSFGGDNTLINNIVISNDKSTVTGFCNKTGIIYSVDYNAYWSTADYFCGFPWKKRKTWTQWRALDNDLNSFRQQPEFVNPAAGDYTPVEASFLCGAAHDGSDIGAIPCK